MRALHCCEDSGLPLGEPLTLGLGLVPPSGVGETDGFALVTGLLIATDGLVPLTAGAVNVTCGGIVAQGGVPFPPTQKRVGVISVLGATVAVGGVPTAFAALMRPYRQKVPVPLI